MDPSWGPSPMSPNLPIGRPGVRYNVIMPGK